ncbi:PREDICTED: protein yippee-like 1 isoform X1 [Lepidothrix coronata]|uniref:Protein yippee-like n=1 Tax=Lepidothrix coronata TaxID=321398 RepID=A0A6J0HBJ8_9PASS|nr:PREDICTED: protein yippee-like 1 isoform X1 [Lepidothrix coronata]
MTLYRCLYKYCHFLLSCSLQSISDQRGKKSYEVTDKTRCVNIFKNKFYIKSFQGSQGRAYLFNSVVNVGCGPAEERVLLTGLHAVADIYCENCKTTLGWKYEHAFESSQKYKEGKFIIELAHMIKDNGWE